MRILARRRGAQRSILSAWMRYSLIVADSGDPSDRYRVDPDDPRAPSQEIWDRLSDAERQAVVASLPLEPPGWDALPPEGGIHFETKAVLRDVLRKHFDRTGRGVFVGCEVAVCYPDERLFMPDVMVVMDTDPRLRERWVVSAEGRGVDVAIEIHYRGSRKKDFSRNVAWFARLGIPEYVVFDRRRLRISGYRLPTEDARAYEPIIPQAGRFQSRVLDMDLVIEDERLRFFTGNAPLLEPDELVGRLTAAVDRLMRERELESERASEEAKRASELEKQLEAALTRLRELEPED